MRYLVMETHPAYAVLLDQEGRYWKAANLRYKVGDTVEEIVPLRQPDQKVVRLGRTVAGLATIAACLCLIFFGYYQPNFTAYGTLRIQINPDVEMTISRTERVLALEGLNQDGLDLIEGYDYQGKGRDTATDELVERAIDMGYLSGGDTISITVSSLDAAWQAEEESQIRQALEERYGQQVTIRIGGAEDDDPDGENPPQEVVIPVNPQTPPPAGTDQPYDDTDYAPNADGITDYDDTDYGPNNDGITDYNDSDYGPYSDGVTDYEDRDGVDDDAVDDPVEDDDAEDDDNDADDADDNHTEDDEAGDAEDDDDGDGDDDDDDTDHEDN